MIKWILEKLGFIAHKVHHPVTADAPVVETPVVDLVTQPAEPTAEPVAQPAAKRVRRAKQASYLKQRKKSSKTVN